MKKKHARDIPDFSRAHLAPKGAPVQASREQTPAPPAQRQITKPKTVAKSGRRGQ